MLIIKYMVQLKKVTNLYLSTLDIWIVYNQDIIIKIIFIQWNGLWYTNFWKMLYNTNFIFSFYDDFDDTHLHNQELR